MSKPLLLDLFCGAGGCSEGYRRAGFDVVGVDINPQPRYPFEFIQTDAINYLRHLSRPNGLVAEFAAIHASPPCQDHSPLRSVAGEHGTGWMLDATRQLLSTLEVPTVIENVMGAEMRRDVVLCADRHFGLRTVRHRQFEIEGFAVSQPFHPKGHSAPTSTKKRRACWDAGMLISVTGDIGTTIGRAALGIDWMNGNELSQAIPPAYTEYIGGYLMVEVLRRIEPLEMAA